MRRYEEVERESKKRNHSVLITRARTQARTHPLPTANRATCSSILSDRRLRLLSNQDKARRARNRADLRAMVEAERAKKYDFNPRTNHTAWAPSIKSADAGPRVGIDI